MITPWSEGSLRSLDDAIQEQIDATILRNLRQAYRIADQAYRVDPKAPVSLAEIRHIISGLISYLEPK